MKMKTDEEKTKEVNDYILKWSKLRSKSRGYKALSILLKHGNLLYGYLGKYDTLELSKVLIYLKCHYTFECAGLQLSQEQKLNFYYKVMYPPRQQYSTENNYTSKRDHRLSVGNEEKESGRHWGNQIMASKNKSE